ncbi:hypothetical protein JHK87_001691 [Glycine soja]|nr:hypothetical protein JHK87_001691 [Glycine soja]
MVSPVKKAIEDAMMVGKKLPKMGEMKEIFKIVWRVERFIKDNGIWFVELVLVARIWFVEVVVTARSVWGAHFVVRLGCLLVLAGSHFE